jgi:hypothetical protein
MSTPTPTPTQSLVSLLIWDITGTTGSTSGGLPTAYNAGITGSALISTSALTTGNAISPNNTWNRTYPNNYTNANDSLANNQYIEWSTTVEIDYEATIYGFAGFNLAKYASLSSTCSAELYYSLDGVNFIKTGSTVTVDGTLTSAASSFSSDLSSNPLVISDQTIIWRLVAYNGVERLGIGNSGTNNISIYGTITSTVTPTPTPSITNSNSPTVTPTLSITNSNSSTATPTLSSTNTPTPTVTPTLSSTNTPTPSITNSNSPTVTPTLSITISNTTTRTPTKTVTASITATKTCTPTKTPTPTPTCPLPLVIYCCDFVDQFGGGRMIGPYVLNKNNSIYYKDDDPNTLYTISYSVSNEQWELRYNNDGIVYYYNPYVSILGTWYNNSGENSAEYASLNPCLTSTPTPTPSVTPPILPEVTLVGMETPTPTPTNSCTITKTPTLTPSNWVTSNKLNIKLFDNKVKIYFGSNIVRKIYNQNNLIQ